MPNNRFTDRTKTSAIRRYESGESPTAIAESIGCSANSIYDWVAKEEGFKDRKDARKKHAGPKSGRVLATRRVVPKRKAATNGALPTMEAPKMRSVKTKPKALVASAVSCPNCGCPIDLKAALRLAVA